MNAIMKLFHRCPETDSEAGRDGYLRGLNEAWAAARRAHFQHEAVREIEHLIEIAKLRAGEGRP